MKKNIAIVFVIVLTCNFLPKSTLAIEDTTPPEVTAFSITPTSFNTESDDVELTLEMTLTDDISGVCKDGDSCSGPQIQVTLTPLIGTQQHDFYTFTRTSGDDLNGTYTATLTIPHNSKEGVWTPSLQLYDKLSNGANMSSDDISSAVPEATGVTLTNTATADSVEIEREWTISSDIADVTFPVDTVVTKQEGGSFAFYQMVSEDYDINGVPQNDLGDPEDAVGKVRIGIPDLNLSFSQNVTVALKVDDEYDGDTLRIQSLGEGQDNWANETECIVADGKCTFTVDHATYFVAFVKKINTIGYFRPSTATFRLKDTNASTGTYTNITWGKSTDKTFSGDWNGNGINTPGFFRPSTATFYLRNTNNTTSGYTKFTYGKEGDKIFSGDWDGDGIDTIGVFRPSTATYYLKNTNASTGTYAKFTYGKSENRPLAGIWK